ncbi:MAG: cytochrome c [Alphaproteobacteria bacterium]|nr:cytochrome c [Alphaproteobacteria bacterium]
MSRRWKIVLGILAAGSLIGLSVAWWLIPPGALAFAGGTRVALDAYSGPNPTGVSTELKSADAVTRGRYLAALSGCQICHTEEGSAPFAGGHAFPTPFGTLYSPNITPDRRTGIGDWSDADFLRAMHKGIAKDGSHLYPAFPYDSYALMTDEDALAIKAYLFSLKPVRQTPPRNTLPFPFNQRWLMGIWGAVYTPSDRFRPHADRSPEWNRGAYLVEALAHCNDCHTERNLAEAPNNRRKFGGGIADGWLAYNITQDETSGLGAWSDDEIARYLSGSHVQGRGAAAGPMAGVVDVELNHASQADIRAMVAYLRSIPPAAGDLPAPRPTAAPDSPRAEVAAFDNRGKHVFEGACASCHGWSGASPLTGYATLTGSRAVNDPSATNVASIVLFGTERLTPQGRIAMPAFGKAYSDAEIAAVANYVTARFGARGSHLTAKDVAKLREGS